MADNLPIEIVEEILFYLKPSDRLAASLTCTLWHEASLLQCMWKDMRVIIENSVEEAAFALKCTRKPVQHLILKDVIFTHHDNNFFKFWDLVGPNILSLQIQNSFITETNLLKMLLSCHSLESLHLHNCRDILITGKLFSNDLVLNHIRKVTPFFKELCFADNCSYLSDALVARFISLSPQLNYLSLAGTSVSFHGGIYKRFYPGDQNKFSELVLTFDNILRHITCHSSTIQHLDLSRTTINDKSCITISQITDLRLKSLILRGCSEISHVGIGALCQTQSTLTKLDLSTCVRVTDMALNHIALGLPKLVSLSLFNCRAVTDTGISYLSQLAHLQQFNGQGLEHMTSNGLENGFLLKPNHKLKKINLSATQVGSEAMNLLSQRALSITHLDLTSCVKAVNDVTLQNLWSNLRQLRELQLDWCVLITDESFRLPQIPGKETNSSCISDCLKGLTDISLSGCLKITDLSLKYWFSFRELRSINLNACSLITDEGLVTLCRNNPGLQILVLNYCTNLSDWSVAELIQLLPRLKRLELQGCSRLTNETLACIERRPRLYQQLTYLNVSQCRLMSLDYAEQLQLRSRSLRELATSGLK